jgi:serine/threonine protein kinase
MIIFNKYEMQELINKGSFGKVYKGKNIRTNENVAIKVESNSLSLLKNEARIYNYLGEIEGIPRLKWFGNDDSNHYLITNLLDYDLSTLKKKHKSLSVPMIRNIGEQMIRRLEMLHNKGLVHRDIKPSNFLFGLNNSQHILHLIDFGFCKRYMYGEKHIELKYTSDIIGTIHYISLNVHKKNEPSRRDDLESVIYILLYLLDLIFWDKLDNSFETISTIYRFKENLIYENIPNYLKEMLLYVRELEFDEKPKYALLIHLLKNKI